MSLPWNCQTIVANLAEVVRVITSVNSIEGFKINIAALAKTKQTAMVNVVLKRLI